MGIGQIPLEQTKQKFAEETDMPIANHQLVMHEHAKRVI